MERNEYIYLTVSHLIETWSELAKRLLQHPEKLVQNQTHYWQHYLQMCQELSLHSTSGSADKRFQYDEWQNNLIFNFIKQSYLLLSEHIDNLIDDVVAKEDAKMAEKIRFFTRQFIDAAAPTNFPNINPEVLAKTLETNGANLVTGFKQFLEDLERGNLKMTDFDLFKLGENIASTPGKVVYQNDLMQLIQYTATTKKTYQFPLLIIPPWINKYYILDLQAENSLVKWLVDQGHTVFMLSWVNPTQKHREKEFADYMFEGPLAALEIIKKITQQTQINILGYCIGGTLLGCMMAYLAEKNDSSLISATFLTTLLDFSEPGELGIFIDENQLNVLENYMQPKGYLDGRVMASVFNALRANDLIWSTFVNNYLKGQKPKAFDLLYWNSDSTNIPERVHSFYLRNMYLENNLVQPGKMKIANVPLDLSHINLPCYFLATQDDHIVPWMTAYKGYKTFKTSTEFVLATSGHVAGVINPPTRNKYGYWINTQNHDNPHEFLEHAHFHQGSWWTHWETWLKTHSGNLITTRFPRRKKIEDAPGSYVKVKLSDIALAEIT